MRIIRKLICVAILAPFGGSAFAINLVDANWNNRDDDLDGIANGVDVWPYESNPGQETVTSQGRTVGAACVLQAIAVPFQATNLTAPHVTYSGATITLKGIARYGLKDQYKWDYGDGSTSGWLSITDPYNLGQAHIYTGAVDTLFVATLSVRSSLYPSETATASFPVAIKDGGTALGTLTPAIGA